ncbi:MAG: hypothetical protein K0V04_45235 [Deltaproteobacteria bacterium]|nr:hypothetical protein [Deltaproteobacteria bacterium]
MGGRASSGAVLWALTLGVGCGGPSSVSSEAAETPAPSAAPAKTVDAGDPLLRDARAGIRDGVLPDPLRQQVMTSTDPAHARAKRVLHAMDAPTEGTVPTESADTLVPPPILPVDDEGAPTAEVPTSGTGASSSPKTPTKTPKPASRPPAAGARVGKVSLRASKRGATMTLSAPSSLVVGIANQPRSGLVRLVIESARAAPAVLTARPSIEGATVTGVRQGQGTIQITLRLDPGWTLGSVKPFSGGARVHLVAPG